MATPGCLMDTRYAREAAEAALSPRVAAVRASELFKIAPNPFDQGRNNQMMAWQRQWQEHAARLIWC